ncbi:MAG: type II toxin-antitoxin system VapC family toxin [Candidatus Binatia bacterium]
MARTVYLETSIISYLAAHPSRDLVTAARQQVTREWWARRRTSFVVYVSEAVIAEARVGDAAAADQRTEILADLPLLDITPRTTQLARTVANALKLPRRAAADAVHIAIAAFHSIDFLLTWNSTHIANAELRLIVEQTCRRRGYTPPILCTPDELMGG